jgi:biotin operon repressor
MSGVTRENYQDHVAALEREHGATVTIRKGDGHTAMNPLEDLPEGKPTVLVVDDLMNDGKPVVVVRT